MRRGAVIAGLALLLALPAFAWGGEKKVVRVWHTETEPLTVAAMQEIANDFEKLHPDISIRPEGLAWGDLEPKLTAALAGLLGHPQAARRRGEAGRERWQREFGVERFRERLRPMLERLIG